MIHTWNSILNRLGIYREVLEEKKIMHRMLEMRPCQTGSRYIDGMQIHSQVFVYYCIYVTKIMSSKALYHIFFNNNL